MLSERCGIFLSYQFSAISRQGFFSEHSTENRYNTARFQRTDVYALFHPIGNLLQLHPCPESFKEILID
jgi:hypothetical protein